MGRLSKHSGLDAHPKRNLRNKSRTSHHASKPRNKRIYTRLSARRKEFRVVQVDPGDRRNVIRCILHVARLGSVDCPPYETISYAWGDPGKVSTVEINGVKTRVPLSCMLALKRMRLTSKIRTLWIDAVCINQADVDERSEQVALMKEIYSNSTGNLVYLGEADSSTDSAFRNINLIMGEIQREFTSFKKFQLAVQPDYYAGEQRSHSGYQGNPDITALQSLFTRPYFRRLWVLPETLVAPSNCCHCGGYELPLIAILRAAVWVRFKAHFIHDLSTDTLPRDALFKWWRELEVKKDAQGQVSFAHPHHSWILSADQDATDERDRIFALAGLLQGNMPEAFQPDYRRSMLAVLRDASRYYYIHERFIMYDMFQETVRIEPDDLVFDPCPSWVLLPSYRRSKYFRLNKLFEAGGRGSQSYFLNAAEYHVFWNPPHPDELVLTGFRADEVDRCTSVIKAVDHKLEIHVLLHWLAEVESLAGITLSRDSTSERLLLLLVLMGGITWDHKLATQEDAVDGSAFYSMLHEERCPITLPHAARKAEAAAYRYYISLLTACMGTRFFVTQSGRFGLGPPLTKPGDITAIFPKCRFPVVLRPFQDFFKTLGPCYVHGIMFGEAVEAYEAAGGEYEQIRIR